MIKIKKGLDVPLVGAPEQKIADGVKIKTVGILSDDYVGMKPTFLVKEGDQVKKGQRLFEDKKTPGVFFTAPAAGIVKTINRGERRVFQSLLIDVTGDEQVQFQSFKNKAVSSLTDAEVRALLQEAGLWTALRTRPFSKTPAVDAKVQTLFVTAMDTHPHAVDADVIIAEAMSDFKAGVEALSKLVTTTFVCTKPGSKVDVSGLSGVKHETFSGPHPAGNVGTHIHYLAPVSANKSVWHIGYQDVIAVGKLFSSGKLQSERVVSLAGPAAMKPRLVRTVLGASLVELTQGEARNGSEVRIVSGSVLGGRKAAGPYCYLGRFHTQISLLKEGREREFLGWHSPGLNKFSLKSVFLSKLIPGKKFDMTTTTSGSHRSVVPIGSYEAVMPGDFLPTQLLRYLLSKNTDRAVELGALELDEEDLALCTFVDPCKNEFGPILRANLNLIEKEG